MPIEESIEELRSDVGDLNYLVRALLTHLYTSEFELTDGMLQHPDGLSFDSWMRIKFQSMDWRYPRVP